jgi:hypothetical protein
MSSNSEGEAEYESGDDQSSGSSGCSEELYSTELIQTIYDMMDSSKFNELGEILGRIEMDCVNFYVSFFLKKVPQTDQELQRERDMIVFMLKNKFKFTSDDVIYFIDRFSGNDLVAILQAAFSSSSFVVEEPSIENSVIVPKDEHGKNIIAGFLSYKEYDKSVDLFGNRFVNFPITEYTTPLLFALMKKEGMEVIKCIIDHGANPNDCPGGYSPLAYALLYNDNFEMASYLISQGVEINMTFGKTLMERVDTQDHFSCLVNLGHPITDKECNNILQFLISKGYEVNDFLYEALIYNDTQHIVSRALDMAYVNNFPETVSYLLNVLNALPFNYRGNVPQGWATNPNVSLQTREVLWEYLRKNKIYDDLSLMQYSCRTGRYVSYLIHTDCENLPFVAEHPSPEREECNNSPDTPSDNLFVLTDGDTIKWCFTFNELIYIQHTGYVNMFNRQKFGDETRRLISNIINKGYPNYIQLSFDIYNIANKFDYTGELLTEFQYIEGNVHFTSDPTERIQDIFEFVNHIYSFISSNYVVVKKLSRDVVSVWNPNYNLRQDEEKISMYAIYPPEGRLYLLELFAKCKSGSDIMHVLLRCYRNITLPSVKREFYIYLAQIFGAWEQIQRISAEQE